MSVTPMRRCIGIGCGNLTRGQTRCPSCQRKLDQAKDKRHNKKRVFYRTTFWRDLRRQAIKRDSVCQVCGEEGKLSVHHIDPRPKDTPYAVSDVDRLSNLIVLCQRCHNRVEVANRQGKRIPLMEAYKSLLAGE